MARRATVGLPGWKHVLVVVAHPDDESFGLGAVISAFIDQGAAVTVLCMTHGEASTLHGVAGDLATVRSEELAAAGRALGVASVRLLDFPDGRLSDTPLSELASLIVAVAVEQQTDGFLCFDATGITGHPDHMHATAAAVAAARELGVGLLAWTLPEEVADILCAESGAAFSGHPSEAIDAVIDVDRGRQREAITCHPSQALPGSVLWRRLELLGDREHLRWLVP